MMLWFRDQGWHWAGGLIAALAFCYGASMAWRIQHIGQVLSLAYLPIAMLCLDRALARGSILYGVAAGIVAACIVLGRDQVALLAIYLLAAFGLWRILSAERAAPAMRASLLPLGGRRRLRPLLIAVPVMLTALLAEDRTGPRSTTSAPRAARCIRPCCSPSCMPDVFGASGRMEDYWGPPSFAWPDTGLFIAQNMGELYIGAIPLLLLLTAAVRGQLWAPEIRFFPCAAAVALLYALGWYTPVFRVLYTLLPGVSLYRRPADATFLIGGLGAILAGYAAHRLFRDAARRTWRGGTASCAAATLGAVACWRSPWACGSAGSQRSAAAVAAGARSRLPARCWRWPGRRRAWCPGRCWPRSCSPASTAADLAYNNGPSSSTAQPPSMYEVLEPDTGNATIAILKSSVVADDTRRDRIELAGLGFHWPNASLTHGLENTLGYNPVRLALYSAGDRRGGPRRPARPAQVLAALSLLPLDAGEPPGAALHRHRRADRDDRPKLEARRPAARSPAPATATSTRTPTPSRACCLRPRRKAADFARMLRRRRVARRRPAHHRAAGARRRRPAPPRRPGRARIVSYRNTEVVLEADSPDGGWVVLNDLWHPWWFAEIDGRPAEILRANVLFRAVAVPPGRHTLRFRFRPIAGAWAQLRR